MQHGKQQYSYDVQGGVQGGFGGVQGGFGGGGAVYGGVYGGSFMGIGNGGEDVQFELMYGITRLSQAPPCSPREGVQQGELVELDLVRFGVGGGGNTSECVCGGGEEVRVGVGVGVDVGMRVYV